MFVILSPNDVDFLVSFGMCQVNVNGMWLSLQSIQ